VVVTDVVPSFLTINSVTVTNPLPPGSVDVTGNTITIDFGTLTPTATCPPASGTSCYVVTIRTTVNSSATPPGGTNTASLTLDPAATDADPDNNADSALTTIVVRSPSEAPETGFAPGRATLLPDQPSSSAYSQLGDLWLEIPALGIRRTITGVPRQAEGWDVKWLGDLAGYLEGTAFPTWSGNSVITGHVVLATGLPGPFARLDRLGYGDSIVVHAWGEKYRYEVRQVSLLKPTDSSIFRHEDRAWVTLVTCQGYDPKSDTYRARQVVRAVLMEVDGETVSAPPAMERGR
jgi:LPXTG-site transpeptidase (sortase) family protein